MTILLSGRATRSVAGRGSDTRLQWNAYRNGFDAMNRIDLEVHLWRPTASEADVLGMMHGLKICSPFLDCRVIEFARRLSLRRKIWAPSKPVLRLLLARLDPNASNDGRKQGFGAPLIEWLPERRFRDLVRDTLGQTARIRNPVAPSALSRQLGASRTQPDRVAAYLIRLFLCLELWAISVEPSGVTGIAASTASTASAVTLTA